MFTDYGREWLYDGLFLKEHFSNAITSILIIILLIPKNFRNFNRAC